MKTKLRRLVSIFSAMVLMVCCAVPAFADDVSSGVSSSNVNREKRFSQMIDYAKNNNIDIENSHYIMTYSEDSSQYYWWYYIFFIPDDILVNDTLILTHGLYSSSFTYSYISGRVSNYGNSDIVDLEYLANVDTSSFSLYVDDDEQSHSYPNHIFKSNIKITNNGDDITPSDPNAPPIPFTVDYSPSLKTGLVRKGTLVAPGASNDGQEVETNTIAVTVKITDAFLNASKPISGAYTYSYQFTCFVVPSEYKDSDIKTMSEHAIYTAAQDNLHYLYYENETLDVDDSLSSEPATGPDMIPVSEQWANATGVSNCFLLERDSNNTPLRNVTIDLHNIDFEKHKSDSYNIVVLGHIVRKSEYGWTAYPSFFKSDCSSLALESTKEYPMNFGSTEQPVINKNFYDYYSVISDDWSFKDYPKFEPHKVGGVTVGDSPLDFKRTAKGVQDYNMWEQGGTDNTLKPDDFDKYKEQKKLDENFGSVDFGLDSIKSVFDGSSDFFKFLTASIGILPTTFLTILISFFVVMLAICVVKWVLK